MSGEAMQSARLTTRRRRRDFDQETLPKAGRCSFVAKVGWTEVAGC